MWLEGHVAIQDLIGPGYTLLRLGGSKAEFPPFKTLDIPDVTARDLYGYDLILLRPDLHIAWRGNRAPAEPKRLAALVTGHT